MTDSASIFLIKNMVLDLDKSLAPQTGDMHLVAAGQ